MYIKYKNPWMWKIIVNGDKREIKFRSKYTMSNLFDIKLQFNKIYIYIYSFISKNKDRRDIFKY